MNPKATWSSSLESYHPNLVPQKVSKNPKLYCIHSSLSKNVKSHFGFLRTLRARHQNFGHPTLQNACKLTKLATTKRIWKRELTKINP
jgi:hypothetical protein